MTWAWRAAAFLFPPAWRIDVAASSILGSTPARRSSLVSRDRLKATSASSMVLSLSCGKELNRRVTHWLSCSWELARDSAFDSDDSSNSIVCKRIGAWFSAMAWSSRAITSVASRNPIWRTRQPSSRAALSTEWMATAEIAASDFGSFWTAAASFLRLVAASPTCSSAIL